MEESGRKERRKKTREKDNEGIGSYGREGERKEVKE